MNGRPELPTAHHRRATAYDVLPDVADLTWTIWNREGCLGEIVTDGDRWFWRHDRADALSDGHPTWQEAVDELISELPDIQLD